MVKNPQPRRKHIPMRTCIACGQSNPKRDLVRVVAVYDGGLVVDPKGKQAGRGAYLCHNPACWDKVLAPRDGNLARALRRVVSADDKEGLRVQRDARLEPVAVDPVNQAAN